MHFIQARILADVIEYIQDKTGAGPHLAACEQNSAGEILVKLLFTIGRDYAGMRPEEPEKP